MIVIVFTNTTAYYAAIKDKFSTWCPGLHYDKTVGRCGNRTRDHDVVMK